MTMLLMLKMLMLACLCLHPTLAVSSDAMVNSTEIISDLLLFIYMKMSVEHHKVEPLCVLSKGH